MVASRRSEGEESKRRASVWSRIKGGAASGRTFAVVPLQTLITPLAWLQLSSSPCQRRTLAAGQRRTLEPLTAIESRQGIDTDTRFTYISTGYNMCYATGE